jgi:acyl-CoA synthetase (AMP-forming)/AMP-acid ligase II
MNGISLLKNSFDSFGTKVAVEDANESWSYSELLSKSYGLSLFFKKTLKSKSKILIIPGKRIEFVASVLACSLGDFNPIFVSEKASPEELEYIKNKTKPALIWDGDFSTIDAKLPTDILFINVHLLFFTSGTTGNPKGICHEFEKVILNANAFNKAATIIAEAFSAMTAMSLWTFSLEKNVNSMWLSPTMVATLTKLCRSEEISEWAKSNLKNVFVGTAPLHEATRKAFREKLGVDCIQSYGMTECMFISVCSGDDLELENSVGKPLEGVAIESRGEEGHIFVKSEFLLKGYLEEGDDINSPDTDNGWLDSGDIGLVDSKNRISITGRHKDLIIKGGLNISPRSIEETLLSYSGVQEVSVVGIPHEFWGEDILACVKLEQGLEIEVNELKLFCREKLSKDAIPGRIVLVEEFPRNSSGKILKKDLKVL